MIEVRGGKGGVTRSCVARGIHCGPVIEIKLGWNIFENGLFEWLMRLSLSGRVWIFVLEPPCTSFFFSSETGVADDGCSGRL